MMSGLLNRLRGQVRVRVECAFPERVLNLCGARDLSFWDLEWENAASFTCRMNRRDYAALSRAAETLHCTLTVVGREGAPFFLSRFRSRQALLAGLVGGGLALFLGSFFIWDFQIEGNETVPEEQILRALEDAGVRIGSFGLSLNGEDIRNRVLLDIPELSWIAVNVSGCRASVQVRERVVPPPLLDQQTPANVVARRAGQVLEIRDWNGRAAVLPGSGVTEGQLLISGVEDTDTFGARTLAGMGSVTARTRYTLTTEIPLKVSKKNYTGRARTKVSLVFGKHRVKIFSNSSIEGAEYDKITKRTPWSLLGVPLPVTWVTETFRFYETSPAALDPAWAERYGEEILTRQLEAMVAPYGVVSSTLCTSRQQGDALAVTLTAECREEIAETVPILTGESP
ncbi:MAG: sporulation protein YqfD [Oscillibacter sp.]|nr:sporulation protein YqfD [Oscillibacter sp.]